MQLINSPRVASLWERLKDCMMRNYGIPLQEVIQENPTRVMVHADALDAQSICQRSCKNVSNTPESAARTRTVTHPHGVMSYTSFTQPCVLAAQMVALEALKEKHQFTLENTSMVAGHSLGEFSALCAIGVFSPETALDLTFKRGVLMESAFEHADRSSFRMYACSPSRAKLHNDVTVADDVFFVLVELIAQSLAATTSFLEVVNFNIEHEQYVVAGDVVALSILGKCLDPYFRANCNAPESSLEALVRQAIISVQLDKRDGVTLNPNKPPAGDFVTAARKRYGTRATFRRFLRGPDDGYTPALEELTHLTLEEDGRSGLKKKSWFVPLTVEVPFHTSRLRQCMDRFLPVVHDALPDEQTLRELLVEAPQPHRLHTSPPPRPLWVTNLTGHIFKPFDEVFQRDAREAIASLNIGEIQHRGRFSSDAVLQTFESGVKEKSVRDICAAVLAAQLAHPVLWTDVMDEVLDDVQTTEVIEISPTRTVSDMFKRTQQAREKARPGEQRIATHCFPADVGYP